MRLVISFLYSLLRLDYSPGTCFSVLQADGAGHCLPSGFPPFQFSTFSTRKLSNVEKGEPSKCGRRAGSNEGDIRGVISGTQ